MKSALRMASTSARMHIYTYLYVAWNEPWINISAWAKSCVILFGIRRQRLAAKASASVENGEGEGQKDQRGLNANCCQRSLGSAN